MQSAKFCHKWTKGDREKRGIANKEKDTRGREGRHERRKKKC